MHFASRALADDLADFLRGREVKARPLNRPQKLVRMVRREPRLAGLLLLFIACTVGFVGGVSTRTSESDRFLYLPSAFLCMLVGIITATVLAPRWRIVTTAVDVKDVNLRIYSGGTQNARIDYTNGRYYVQNNKVIGLPATGWTTTPSGTLSGP